MTDSSLFFNIMEFFLFSCHLWVSLLWSECGYLACLISVDIWDDMVFLLLSYLLFFLIMTKSNLTLFHPTVKYLRTMSLILTWTYDISHLLWKPTNNPWNGAVFNGIFWLVYFYFVFVAIPLYNISTSKPIFGPVRLELPSLWYLKTDLGDWGHPLRCHLHLGLSMVLFNLHHSV